MSVRSPSLTVSFFPMGYLRGLRLCVSMCTHTIVHRKLGVAYVQTARNSRLPGSLGISNPRWWPEPGESTTIALMYQEVRRRVDQEKRESWLTSSDCGVGPFTVINFVMALGISRSRTQQNSVRAKSEPLDSIQRLVEDLPTFRPAALRACSARHRPQQIYLEPLFVIFKRMHSSNSGPRELF